VRFNRAISGPIGPLIAPPYDVAARPRDGAEYSIGGIEYVDLGVPGDQHDFAAARYDDWLRQGILVRDATPAIYLHRHQFEDDGAPRTRTGLLARVRLADWEERIVLPHEQTTPGPRLERLGRLRAVQANLSPLYFLYRDPGGSIRELLAPFVMRDGETGERDRMGGTHRIVRLGGISMTPSRRSSPSGHFLSPTGITVTRRRSPIATSGGPPRPTTGTRRRSSCWPCWRRLRIRGSPCDPRIAC
jgi:hypothetical protein